MTNPTLTRSPECALGYPEACTDPTCSDPVHLPDRGVVDRSRGIGVVARGRPTSGEAQRPMKPVLDRFLAKVDNSGGPDACHPWTASKTPHGYGYFVASADNRTYAHRWIIGHLRGEPLKSAEIVRHGCDNPCCVNPSHLAVGTQVHNMRECVERGRHRNPIADANRLATHCHRGHEFTGANTYRPTPGKRSCRECARLRRLR